MKKYLLYFIILTILLPGTAFALSGSAFTNGGMTFFSFDDGTSGSAFTNGGMTFFSFDDGTSGSAFTNGGMTYYSFNAPKSTEPKETSTYYNEEECTRIKNEKLYWQNVQEMVLMDESKVTKEIYSKTISEGSYTWDEYQALNEADKSSFRVSNLAAARANLKTITEEVKDFGCQNAWVEPVKSILYCSEYPHTKYSSGKCICDDNYIVHGESCITYDEKCKILYGQNSNGGKNENGFYCGCGNGYYFNLDKKFCINNNNHYLLSRTSGHILLQVEANGEAWYVNPADSKRYYLGRPADAFKIMGDLGIGAKNIDLNKISVGTGILTGEDFDSDGLPDIMESALNTDPKNKDTDGDGYDDKYEIEQNYDPTKNKGSKIAVENAFAEQQKGRILLQIENKGEAWYINPNDGKRYFLGRPEHAFNIMRKTGLGITNDDINKIEVKQ